MSAVQTERPVVLIVDDEENHRLLYKEELEDAGYEVIAAKSGPEAIEIAGQRRVDVAVVDIAMPGMDGVETISRLLNIDRSIPIIIHTAYCDFEDDFTTWVAEKYLIKTPDISRLVEAVDEVLERRGVAAVR